MDPPNYQSKGKPAPRVIMPVPQAYALTFTFAHRASENVESFRFASPLIPAFLDSGETAFQTGFISYIPGDKRIK